MKTLYLKESIEAAFKTCSIILKTGIALFAFSAIIALSSASAQTPVLFDFDNAPLHSSLPINLTASGITAHFSYTGIQGYSIQEANVLGFVPQGFAGRVIYPNSINLADLLISFDQPLTGFSIMYACQELGCDDAATMRVTTYMNGSVVGTKTQTASHPGTWPVETLSCSFQQGFDSVVIHYDSRPPTCQDYGVIFMADNMQVIPLNPSGISNLKLIPERIIVPNPVSQSAIVSFSLSQTENIRVAIRDLTGKLIKNLFSGTLSAGEHQINWVVSTDAIKAGVYFLNLTGEHSSGSYKFIVLK